MENAAPKPQKIFWILAGITIVGIALRLYHLNFQSLWYDELHSIIPTDPDNSLSSIIDYCKRDQPPGYFFFLHGFFHVFGYNEVTGRVASVFLGILAIPVMYFFGKEIRGEEVGIAAAGLTSLNYMHIYYSQELRFYTMVFLLTALSFLFFIRAFRKGRNIDFMLYVLFTSALLYSHYYGLLIFAVQVIAFLAMLLYRRDKPFVLKSVLSGISVLVLFLPWVPVILSDLQLTSFWIRKPEPTFLADYFYYYFGKDALTTAVFVVLIFLFFRNAWSKGKLVDHLTPIHLILVIWLVFSYLIPYVKSLTGTPVLYVRYTIVSLPAWILIIAIGWDTIRNEKLKYGLVIAVSLSMCLNTIFFRKHYVRPDKQQFREVSELIKEKNSGYPIYSRFAWHFNYYFRDYPQKPGDLDVGELAGVDAFWLLHAEFFSKEEKAQIIGELNGKFEIAESYPFHKAEALLMKRITPGD